VDCSPRNPDDLESLDKNEECDSASTKEKPADETDEKQVEQIELEIEEEEGEGEVSESKENEARVFFWIVSLSDINNIHMIIPAYGLSLSQC